MLTALLAATMLFAQFALPEKLPKNGVNTAAAARRVGDKLVACGVLTDLRKDSGPKPRAVFELDGTTGGPVLTVLVWPKHFDQFPESVPASVRGRWLCVSGKVQLNEKRPEIELTKWEQFVEFGGPRYDDEFAPGVVTGGAVKGLTNPTLVTNAEPSYTKQAMKHHVTGIAELHALVGIDGRVEKVRLVKSVDPFFGLDEEAQKAAVKWLFKPATLNGVSVPCVVTLLLEFRLH